MNAEPLLRSPPRPAAPSCPPRLSSATGLGVSPPAPAPCSHSSAGSGGSSWSGVRTGTPVGRKACRRCSSRSLSDQNGFGSIDLVLLDMISQQRELRWVQNLLTELAGMLFIWSIKSLQSMLQCCGMSMPSCVKLHAFDLSKSICRVSKPERNPQQPKQYRKAPKQPVNLSRCNPGNTSQNQEQNL